MTVEEAGRKGGLRTAETHGEEFYIEIGRKGGKIAAKEFVSSFEKEKNTKKNR